MQFDIKKIGKTVVVTLLDWVANIVRIVFMLVLVAIIGGFIFWVILGLTSLLAAPLDGPLKCREEVEKRYKEVMSEGVETDYFFTRTLENHNVSGLLIQPKDLQLEPYTLICHFKQDTDEIDRIEFQKGNVISKIKNITKSNFSPLTWLIQM